MPRPTLAATLAGPRVRGALLVSLGPVAMLAPFLVEWALSLIGLGVAALGVTVLVHTFRATDSSLGSAAYASGGASVIVGLLVFLHPVFARSGLLALVALVFVFDGAEKLLAALRGTSLRTARTLTNRELG